VPRVGIPVEQLGPCRTVRLVKRRSGSSKPLPWGCGSTRRFNRKSPRTQYITVIFSNIIPYPEYPLVIYNRLRTGRYHQFSFFWGEITDKWVIFIHMLHYQMVNSCQQPVKQWNFHQNFDMEPAGASPNSWPIARNHDKFHELFWWYQTFQAIIFVTNNSTINNILR